MTKKSTRTCASPGPASAPSAEVPHVLPLGLLCVVASAARARSSKYRRWSTRAAHSQRDSLSSRCKPSMTATAAARSCRASSTCASSACCCCAARVRNAEKSAACKGSASGLSPLPLMQPKNAIFSKLNRALLKARYRRKPHTATCYVAGRHDTALCAEEIIHLRTRSMKVAY